VEVADIEALAQRLLGPGASAEFSAKQARAWSRVQPIAWIPVSATSRQARHIS